MSGLYLNKLFKKLSLANLAKLKNVFFDEINQLKIHDFSTMLNEFFKDKKRDSIHIIIRNFLYSEFHLFIIEINDFLTKLKIGFLMGAFDQCLIFSYKVFSSFSHNLRCS